MSRLLAALVLLVGCSSEPVKIEAPKFERLIERASQSCALDLAEVDMRWRVEPTRLLMWWNVQPLGSSENDKLHCFLGQFGMMTVSKRTDEPMVIVPRENLGQNSLKRHRID